MVYPQGVEEKTWQAGIFKRLIKKLELLGCIRRVKALGPSRRGKGVYTCLKFVREPVGHEWRLSASQALLKGESLARRTKKEQNLAPSGPDNDNDAAESSLGTPAQTGTAGSQSIGEGHTKIRRIVPQWQPYIPLANMLRSIVEASGTTGISTMVRPSLQLLFLLLIADHA